jgi:hypothetical protein
MLGAFSAAGASAEYPREEAAIRHTTPKDNAPVLLSILRLQWFTVVLVTSSSALITESLTFPDSSAVPAKNPEY